jgi:hypothetical protein
MTKNSTLPAAVEMRPTALFLNVVAASYATWRQQLRDAIELKSLWWAILPAFPAAFFGGMIEISGNLYFVLTGALPLIAAALLLLGRGESEPSTRPVVGTLSPTLAGAGAGFLSGLTDVGGGVFGCRHETCARRRPNPRGRSPHAALSAIVSVAALWYIPLPPVIGPRPQRDCAPPGSEG